MTHLGLELEHERTHHRKHRRRSRMGCVAVGLAIAVLLVGAYLLYHFGISTLRAQLSPPEDYPGPGRGSVLIEVESGDTASDIAATLVEHDVVASREAFTDAAVADPASQGIQVGFYEMRKQMSAEDALDILVDPANVVKNTIAFPEGWTVEQIVERLAAQTDFSKKEYRRVLAKPQSIGLPAYAEGNPEGYLFPATYQVPPKAGPRDIVTMMVDRYKQAAEELNLVKKSDELGVSPHDVMTVASLIQAEARFDKDFPRVSRVIYNRLEEPMALQFDSTVHYAVGKTGRVGTSDADRDVDSPYNTYKHTGLPPTPIMAPGEQAIDAALNPADGPWLFFVTTNPDTGETKFAETYDEHLTNKREFERWCAESPNC